VRAIYLAGRLVATDQDRNEPGDIHGIAAAQSNDNIKAVPAGELGCLERRLGRIGNDPG
jgi:hypothetical protein